MSKETINHETTANNTMKNKKAAVSYIICRVCGYIETSDYADKPCPACGFPKTVWMEYKPRRLSNRRQQLLALHLHPIAVHFPIVASTGCFLVPLIALFMPYQMAYHVFDVVNMVSIIIPLLALIGGVSGMIGGKLRYKTVTKAPLLRQKLYVSILFLIITLIHSYYAITHTITAENAFVISIFGLIETILCAWLGKKGSHLFGTLFGPYVQG